MRLVSTRESGCPRQSTPSGAASAAASAAPLKLADFPATKDGDLARKICQAWAGLRGQRQDRAGGRPGLLVRYLVLAAGG
jgi:hypothetical protein